jgi:hypothetical protein
MSKAQKDFKFGPYQIQKTQKQIAKAEFEAFRAKNFKFDEDGPRTFRADRMNSEFPDKIAYRGHFVIDTFTIAQPIGLRTFKSGDIAVDGSIVEGADPGIDPAKFSVIVDTSQMVLYSLEKKYIAFIPKGLMVRLFFFGLVLRM